SADRDPLLQHLVLGAPCGAARTLEASRTPRRADALDAVAGRGDAAHQIVAHRERLSRRQPADARGNVAMPEKGGQRHGIESTLPDREVVEPARVFGGMLDA